MLPHPLANFAIQKNYQKEPRFNCGFLRNNLPKIKDGAYVVNLDEYKSVGSHQITLHANGFNVIFSQLCC